MVTCKGKKNDKDYKLNKTIMSYDHIKTRHKPFVMVKILKIILQLALTVEPDLG